MTKDYKDLQTRFRKANRDGIKLLLIPRIEKRIKELPSWWLFINSFFFGIFIIILFVIGIAAIATAVATWLILNPGQAQVYQIALAFAAIAVFLIAFILFVTRITRRNKIIQYLSNVIDKTLIYKRVFANFQGFKFYGAADKDFLELSSVRHTGEFEIPEEGLINSRTNQMLLEYNGSKIIFQLQSYTWGKKKDLFPKRVIGLVKYDLSTSQKNVQFYKKLIFTLKSDSPRFDKLREFESANEEFDSFFKAKTNSINLLKELLDDKTKATLLNLAKSGIRAKKWSLEKIDNSLQIKFVPYIDYTPSLHFGFSLLTDKIANNFANSIINEIFQIYLLIRIPIELRIV
ncbi:hypothetical protein CJJ23_02785 [Mycoplasmopsis agassizii]|uniref:DUF3137 domain-containing protein n=1 Tax=Mycoplasmopsis agassizii TaxID=33922 RepID=A0A269TK77_9BACT|nr:hypothetical protein [Mycoplasmopsis agassizii]PAK21338.1 hypothetical protein CJJ23_02785 [Mycoplasmopsis agassizii]